jgi:acyl-CoA thioesterase II
MSMSEALVNAFTLREIGPGRYAAASVPSPHRPVVFGGQLLGQSALAAEAMAGGKAARSVQTLFARAGDVRCDVALNAEVIHDGRTIGSAVVRAAQGDRTLCQSLVLLDAGDADLVRHAAPMPDVPGPDAAETVTAEPGTELRLIGGAAILAAGSTGPAQLHAWARFPGAAGQPAGVHRALLSWYTDGLLIAAAMRPHALGQEMAHESVSTGVLAHSITFHEDHDTTQWMLITQTSTYAGGGRCYGHGAVYAASGELVASFSQQGMVRAFDTSARPGATTMAM